MSLNINDVMENVYSGRSPLECKTEFIYDKLTVNLYNGIRAKSRYKFLMSRCEYEPYSLSKQFLKSLSSVFTVVRNIKFESELIEDNIISMSKSKVLINEFHPSFISQPLLDENNDYTPLGLYALLFGRYYGDQVFKTKVETDLLELGYEEQSIGNKNVFVSENSSELSLLNAVVSRDTNNIPDCIFYWKEPSTKTPKNIDIFES